MKTEGKFLHLSPFKTSHRLNSLVIWKSEYLQSAEVEDGDVNTTGLEGTDLRPRP